MKELIISLVLLGAFITCTHNKNDHPALEQSTINILKQTPSDGLIIDCRTPEEFLKAHVPGAQNINILDDSIVEQIALLDKNKKYYIYCAGGFRSGKMVEALLDQGFTQLVDLSDGFTNWDGKISSVVSQR